MKREDFEKKYTKKNSVETMTAKDFHSYKKVIISEYYELIAKTCYEFIEGLDNGIMTNAQAEELMASLAHALRGGHKENVELGNYVANYTMSRVIGEMIGNDEFVDDFLNDEEGDEE